jgi:hypothetical protein
MLLALGEESGLWTKTLLVPECGMALGHSQVVTLGHVWYKTILSEDAKQ